MDRYDDIELLLDDSREKIQTVKREYQNIRTQKPEDPKLVLTIKHCLLNLRSVLEYATQEIWQSYNKTPKKRLYFPYGETELLFNNSLKSNLPSLESCKPNVAKLIRDLQPFTCGDNWLLNLCEQVNTQKHDRLSRLIKKVSPEKATILRKGNQGGAIIISGDSRITFDGGTFNGAPIGRESNVVISTTDDVKDLTNKLSSSLDILQSYNWISISVYGSNAEVLDHLTKSEEKISEFVTKLKTTL